MQFIPLRSLLTFNYLHLDGRKESFISCNQLIDWRKCKCLTQEQSSPNIKRVHVPSLLTFTLRLSECCVSRQGLQLSVWTRSDPALMPGHKSQLTPRGRTDRREIRLISLLEHPHHRTYEEQQIIQVVFVHTKDKLDVQDIKLSTVLFYFYF